MTAVSLLAHLLRPEVAEVLLASGRRPQALVNGEVDFIAEAPLTHDDLVRLLFSAGGSRYIDGLSARPTQWRTRVEGVGAVGVTASSRGAVIEARFTLREAASVAPASLGPAGSPRRVGTGRPAATPDGRAPTRSSKPPAHVEDWSSRPTRPMMERAVSIGNAVSMGNPVAPSLPVPQTPPVATASGEVVELELPPSFPTAPPPADTEAAPPRHTAALSPTLPNLRLASLAQSGALGELFASARDSGASDIHLAPGRPAVVRVGGRLVARDPVLEGTTVATLLLGYAPRRVVDQVEGDGAATFALDDTDLGRFRVHLLRSRAGLAASIRPIPRAPPSLAALGLEVAVGPLLTRMPRFLLVSSPLGNGRTTTLASIVDRVGAERALTIVTVEDPIEHVLPARRALVRQIEVGAHAIDRAAALASALTDEPDLLVLGDLADAAAVRFAQRAMERGSIVLASIPAAQPARALDLMLAKLSFPERRSALAALVRGRVTVIAQRLVHPSGDLEGPLVASVEVQGPPSDTRESTRQSTIPPASGPSGSKSVRPPSLRPPPGGIFDRVFKKGG